jgi:phosphopentomutase
VYLDPALKLRFVHPKKKDTNPFSIQGTVNALQAAHAVYRPKGTFIFTNLVDTDSVYGHTREVEGTLKSLEEIDRCLPLLERHMEKGDLLGITADHGMAHREDYGYHSNEPLPFIAAVKGGDKKLGGLKAGAMPGLLDIGNVFAQYFGLQQEYKKIVKL